MSKALLVWLQLLFGTVVCLSTSPILAQVTSDDTVNTQVDRDGNVAEITGGETRGSNLFHSFQDFSVGAGNEAYFNNASDISDIFSRVTGGNISNIDGLIRANGSANLFLINPAGIIFGEGARLDIGGSFYGSSASSILFEDGEYSAVDNLEQPILTINAPIGLGFRDEPGDIVNRSIVQNSNESVIGLEVAPGNNLTFVGGNLNFEGGNLTARGGNIFLGGLNQAGTVDLNENGSLSFPEGMTLANITLTNAADIDVSGTGGGNIDINARNLSLAAGEEGSSEIRGGITADSTSIEAQAGDITINVAENISINNSGIGNQVFEEGGNSGNIVINTGSLELINGGAIIANTFGQGNVGEINVTAKGDITADGESDPGFFRAITTSAITTSGITTSGITSRVNLGAGGDAGGVTISTTNLNLTNGGVVTASTLGSGNAGEVNVTARGDITVDGESDQGFSSGITSAVAGGGNADGVTISTTNLNLADGGQIFAGTLGSGNAGEVNITARGDIAADGSNSQGFFSGITSQVSEITEAVEAIFGSAKGAQGGTGGATIRATNLALTDGGQISAQTRGVSSAGNVNVQISDTLTARGLDSGIFGRTGGTGDAGTVSITTPQLKIENNAQIGVDNFIETELQLETITNPSGEPLLDSQGNQITRIVRTFNPVEGSGSAGTLEIASDNVELNGGHLTAISAGGNGGNINIESNRLSLGNGAEITATAGEMNTSGNGGNINIDSQFIVAFPQGNNDITANAFNGDGGNISIATEGIFGIQERPDNFLTNDITASSEAGISGNISINRPDINPLQGASELPPNIAQPSETTQQACATNREAEAKNGLEIVGKGGVPPAPDLPLNSLNTISNGEINSVSTIPAPIETSQGKIQPARGIEVTESGVIRLTAYRTNNAGDRLSQTESSCG